MNEKLEIRMNNVEIRRTEVKDTEKLNELFRVVITDTFT